MTAYLLIMIHQGEGEENMTHFIVQTASATMPASCWGKYRRVAVLEVEAGMSRASMISERARGVKRIVETWERCNVGSTDRCAYSRALKEATDLADKLNAADGTNWFFTSIVI